MVERKRENVVVTLLQQKNWKSIRCKGGRSINGSSSAAAASILPCVWLLCRFWCGADLKARKKIGLGRRVYYIMAFTLTMWKSREQTQSTTHQGKEKEEKRACELKKIVRILFSKVVNQPVCLRKKEKATTWKRKTERKKSESEI